MLYGTIQGRSMTTYQSISASCQALSGSDNIISYRFLESK